MRRPLSVLLTGASGVIGTALLGEVTDMSVTCLVHRSPVAPYARGHVASVHGDISKDLIGLSRADFDALAKKIDVVVHSAAVTDFTAGDATTAEMNVGGTRNVLGFASHAGAPIYYVSTAFIQRIPEMRSSGFGTSACPAAYLRSKHEAEEVVAGSDVPAVVLRPSMVLGDSGTGQISAFQGLHAIVGAVLKGALPLLPILPEALIDFVPQDYVAAAIATLLRAGEQEGSYWITAGDGAMRASDMVAACMQLAASLGLRIDAPRLVPPDTVDRLIRPVFIEPLPEKAKARFDRMLNMTALFSAGAPFPGSAPELERRFGLTGPHHLSAVFTRSMEFWASRNGLAPPLPSTLSSAV